MFTSVYDMYIYICESISSYIFDATFFYVTNSYGTL